MIACSVCPRLSATRTVLKVWGLASLDARRRGRPRVKPTQTLARPSSARPSACYASALGGALHGGRSARRARGCQRSWLSLVPSSRRRGACASERSQDRRDRAHPETSPREAAADGSAGSGAGWLHAAVCASWPVPNPCPNVSKERHGGKRDSNLSTHGKVGVKPLPTTTSDSPPFRREAWGTRGPRFKSGRPDWNPPLSGAQ